MNIEQSGFWLCPDGVKVVLVGTNGTAPILFEVIPGVSYSVSVGDESWFGSAKIGKGKIIILNTEHP